MTPPPISTTGLPLGACAIELAYTDRGATPRSVLDIADLHVRASGQIAICGPSGSGKTTLLHVLAGIERPARGTVHWGAVEVTALSQTAADRWRRETLGIVFQELHLFPGLTALDNVLLPFRFDHWRIVPAMRSRAEALLDRVGVRPHADIAALSRGEAQRVAVARALVRGPMILLADEPTASLDPAAAGEVAGTLCALCREAGATLVVATHDPAVASRMERIYDMVDGAPCLRGTVAARPRLAHSA